MATKRPPRAPRTATPTVEPPEDQFTLVPNGGIEWRIKGVDYRLRKVRVGEWHDLNELRLANVRKIATASAEALALPVATTAEVEARYTALQGARDLSYTVHLDWWVTLFKTVCVTAAIPEVDDLPGWATDTTTQERALAHLVGPFDSGPSPDPTT